MTLEQMELAGQERTRAILGSWTDKPTGETEKLLSHYKTAYDEITDNLDKAYLKLTGTDPADAGYYNELIKFGRLESLQKQTAKAYTDAARKAGKAQFAISETAMSNTYYQNMYSVNWFSDQFFTVIDEKAVEVAVFGTDEIWQSIDKANKAKYAAYLPQYGTLADKLNSNAIKDLEKIKSSIIAALRQGNSFDELARDLQNIFNTTANNALRIARTEGHRAMSSGAYAQTQAAVNAGIGLTRMYSAVLDTRTRQQSGSMDGQIVGASEPFVYPNGATALIVGNSGVPRYDINDRCWSLDIVDDTPPEARRGLNPATGESEVASYRTFDVWMKDNDLIFTKSGKIMAK
jgi:hypothetical protein